MNGHKRGNLELAGYISNGAQDLVLDLSFRHYRAGAASRNWHRNGELLRPGNPDKDLDEKAARKIAKYRELYRDHRRQAVTRNSCRPSPALPGGFIASCCACCFYTRTGRRSLSDILDDAARATSHTHISVYVPPRCCLQHSQEQDGHMVARASALRTNINIDGRPLPTKKRWRTSSTACAPHLLHACALQFHLPVTECREWQ